MAANTNINQNTHCFQKSCSCPSLGRARPKPEDNPDASQQEIASPCAPKNRPPSTSRKPTLAQLVYGAGGFFRAALEMSAACNQHQALKKKPTHDAHAPTFRRSKNHLKTTTRSTSAWERQVHAHPAEASAPATSCPTMDEPSFDECAFGCFPCHAPSYRSQSWSKSLQEHPCHQAPASGPAPGGFAPGTGFKACRCLWESHW